MGKLTLKKVKASEELSEETLCFSADLYEDGKLVAHVSNRGRGGSNMIRPAKGLTYDDVKHLDNIDTECDILTLAEDIHFLKRNQTKKFVLKMDGNYYTTAIPHGSIPKLKKELGIGNYKVWIEKTKADFEKAGYELLNRNL